MTVDLVPLAGSQRALIGALDRERGGALMVALDACNGCSRPDLRLVVGPFFLSMAVWRSDGSLFVAGVSATLGGIVLAGSTTATRIGLTTGRGALEARRAE